MDLTSIAILSLFAAALAGGLMGLLVGRLTRFEIGLAVGLLIFGGTNLFFAGRCYLEYRDFAYAGANGLWGEVIRIEEIPIGGGTQTAPLVRFRAPDNSEHTVLGPRANSAKVGEHLIVIYDPVDPQRSRVGSITELRGCAIAMLLFGTFPVSFALFMLYSTIAESVGAGGLNTGAPRRRGRSARADPAHSSTAASASRRESKVFAAISMTLYLTMFGAIVWIGLASGDHLGARFSRGFGVVAGALVGYAILGLVGRQASSVWAFGVVMLALNFGVWAWALHLLV